jgi:hypothetical protein
MLSLHDLFSKQLVQTEPEVAAKDDEEVEIDFGAKQPEPDQPEEMASKEEGFGQIFNKLITPPSEPGVYLIGICLGQA